jgi:hypothetical protein
MSKCDNGEANQDDVLGADVVDEARRCLPVRLHPAVWKPFPGFVRFFACCGIPRQ